VYQALIPIENWNWLLKESVCNKCQQKSSTAENKRHIVFVDEVETQLREKLLRGNQTQEFHYSEDEARYKIVPLTLTRCSGRTLLFDV
jgi:CHASE1-domain containing sensor protein